MNPRLLKLLAIIAATTLGLLSAWRHRFRATRDHSPPAPQTRVIVVEPPSLEPRRAGWKQWALRIAAVLVLLATGGFLTALSGVVSIKASAGHWPVTRWFLEFSKSRSVSTHTLRTKVPPLDDRSKVLKGAGHFEIGCAPCHGSPARLQPRVAQYMLPHPPALTDISASLDDAELFYIVKHGIKLTGMPAWPAAHRDDEVWAMVAFLRELPKISATQYRELAGFQSQPREGATIENLQPPVRMPEVITDSCARCHGVDGNGRGLGAFPVLAGQTPEYLRASLIAYANGKRHSGVMGPVAAGLTAQSVEQVATFYAGQQPRRNGLRQTNNAGAIARGREIALNGIPARQVPACVECHGPREGPRNPHYPVLAGQYADYLVLQLELFSKKHRGGTPYSHLMHSVAGNLKPEQMQDVAAYFDSLPPTAPTARMDQ